VIIVSNSINHSLKLFVFLCYYLSVSYSCKLVKMLCVWMLTRVAHVIAAAHRDL